MSPRCSVRKMLYLTSCCLAQSPCDTFPDLRPQSLSWFRYCPCCLALHISKHRCGLWG